MARVAWHNRFLVRWSSLNIPQLFKKWSFAVKTTETLVWGVLHWWTPYKGIPSDFKILRRWVRGIEILGDETPENQRVGQNLQTLGMENEIDHPIAFLMGMAISIGWSIDLSGSSMTNVVMQNWGLLSMTQVCWVEGVLPFRVSWWSLRCIVWAAWLDPVDWTHLGTLTFWECPKTQHANIRPTQWPSTNWIGGLTWPEICTEMCRYMCTCRM